MIKFFRKHKLLGLILLIGLILRFYRLPAYMEFLGDQGRDVLHVRRFLKQGDLMFIGPQTSIGNMYLGPWYYYLIAPFLLLANFSPVGPAVLSAFVGVATIWLVWKVGKEWFNPKVGLVSAALMGFSPVVTKYSTFSWNPNIMPFFSLLSIWFLWRVWQKNDYKFLIWLAISLVMVLNSHYLGLLLFPVVGLFLIVKSIRVIRDNNFSSFAKFVILSIGVFILLMSPLLLFDLKHDFVNYKAFKKFFTVRQTTVNFKFYKGFAKLPNIFNQLVAQLFLNKDSWQWGFFLVPIILWGSWKKRKNKAFWLVVVWLVVGLVGVSNYKQHIYAHYYLFLYPAVCLLIALGLERLNLVGLGLGLVAIGIMFSNWHGRKKPNFQLKRARVGAEEICERVEENLKYNIVNLASYNDFRAMSYRYFMVDNCKIKPIPDTGYPDAHELFVIQEDPEKYPDPINADIWEIQSGGKWREEVDWTAFDVKIYRLVK